MGIAELFLLALGLATDAFSVSVCKGLSMKKKDYSASVIIALFFGVFQAIMPLIGYFVGSRFGSLISGFSHWIAFFLLGIIGIKMIAETLHSAESNGDTSAFCLLGVVIGNKFGSKYERKAGIAGGVILILIGAKFLLDAV